MIFEAVCSLTNSPSQILFMSFLPKNLRYLRKRRSERQADVAKQVKKRQNTIGNWENGISEPSIRELYLLSGYFDVSLDDLVFADLEKLESLIKADIQTGSSFAKSTRHDLHFVAKNMANEGNRDQFWLIARELRKINEKLDVIKLNLGFNAREIDMKYPK
ncbi:MAG: hypothetical protein C5B59_18610 [Bacteroidetes bacterium]|nr:MAG: hypothetical protein C5B59_18610 [Bacteroidota bacterium]